MKINKLNNLPVESGGSLYEHCIRVYLKSITALTRVTLTVQHIFYTNFPEPINSKSLLGQFLYENYSNDYVVFHPEIGYSYLYTQISNKERLCLYPQNAPINGGYNQGSYNCGTQVTLSYDDNGTFKTYSLQGSEIDTVTDTVTQII